MAILDKHLKKSQYICLQKVSRSHEIFSLKVCMNPVNIFFIWWYVWIYINIYEYNLIFHWILKYVLCDLNVFCHFEKFVSKVTRLGRAHRWIYSIKVVTNGNIGTFPFVYSSVSRTYTVSNVNVYTPMIRVSIPGYRMALEEI